MIWKVYPLRVVIILILSAFPDAYSSERTLNQAGGETGDRTRRTCGVIPCPAFLLPPLFFTVYPKEYRPVVVLFQDKGIVTELEPVPDTEAVKAVALIQL